MANRYWVGGAGSWTNTAKWSTTSGGAGGASIPTSADDVFFDANSGGGNITISTTGTCRNLDTTGFTGTLGTGGFSILAGGSVTIGASTNIVNPMSLTMDSANSRTLNIAGTGNRLISLDVTGNGSLEFTSDINITAIDGINAGTGEFIVVGKNLTVNGVFVIGQRPVNFTNSTIDVAGTILFSIGTSTFNATGSSVIARSGFTASKTGGPLIQFHNVTHIAGAASSISWGGSQQIENFTIDLSAMVRADAYAYSIATGNSVINNLTIIGNDSYPVLKSSNTLSKTLTANSLNISKVCFNRIAALGNGGNPWTGTYIFDYGGNSNITFTPPATMVVSASANINLPASWDIGRTPSLTDNVIVRVESTTTDLILTAPTMASILVGSLKYENTGTRSISASGIQWRIASGGVTVDSNVTTTSARASVILCHPQEGTYNITCNATTQVFNTLAIQNLPHLDVNPNNTFNFAGTLIVNAITARCVMNLGTSSITCTSISTTGATNTVINCGDSTLTSTGISIASSCSLNLQNCLLNLRAGASALLTLNTGSSFSAGTSTINLGNNESLTSSTEGIINVLNGTTFNNVVISGTPDAAGRFPIRFTAPAGSTINFNSLNSVRTGAAYSIRFIEGNTYTFNNFQISGNSGNLVSIVGGTTTSTTAANCASFTYTGSGVVSCNYLNVRNVIGSPTNTWYMGANSVNGVGNTNLIFQNAPGVGIVNSLFFCGGL